MMLRSEIWLSQVCGACRIRGVISTESIFIVFVVSQRGVVFFRNQDIGIEDQKILGQKLGELTGKPESSKVRAFSLFGCKF
jgi:hypothetical protein